MSEEIVAAADVTVIHNRSAVQSLSAAAVERILVDYVMKHAKLLFVEGTTTTVKFMYAGSSFSSVVVTIEQDLLYVAPPAEMPKVEKTL